MLRNGIYFISKSGILLNYAITCLWLSTDCCPLSLFKEIVIRYNNYSLWEERGYFCGERTI